MASLPSVALTGSLKFEPEFRKYSPSSLASEKSRSVSHHKSYTTTQSDQKPDPSCMDIKEALSLLKDGTKIESAFYVPLLQESIDENSVSDAQIIHGHIIKTGTYEDLFIMTFLINVYAKCGTMEAARKIFDKLPRRNVVTWTALITGYVHNSQPELAILVFQELLETGAYPTNYTLGAVLSACSSLYSIELGKQVHGYIIKYQIEYDTSMGNSLCSLYSKCGNLESAVKAFKRVPEKNTISWTTAISACGDNGQAEMGLRFFVEMLSEDTRPNEFTLTSVLSLCCIIQTLGVGKQIHSLSIRLGYESNLPIKNSIMYLYLKCGWIDGAQKSLSGMKTVSLVTWNALIAGHAQMMNCAKDDIPVRHSGTEALNIFLKLNRSNTKPDLFTFSSILTVCSNMVALEQGEQIHAQAMKTGFLSDVVVGSALVNMYNKCGSIERASKAFVEMSKRTLISWTSMITGFAQHGRSYQALQLFEDMRLAGVRPNKITFVGVLSACSHAGMVKEALSYFEIMKNEYGINPVMDHYACLIDMFVRLGRLDEAFDFIQKMDFEPNEVIWSILIAGCRSHGNMELGFYAAERLLELKPKDAETYVLLLNMYLSAGRWKDVSRVRKMMRDEKIGRLKDCSWISIKDKVYSFLPDDKSFAQSEQAYDLLEDLLAKAKNLGYVSKRSLEIVDEEDDEKIISSIVHHSERLAIAFGLLNMPKGAHVRVIKNISMCRDCHSFIKFISVFTGRKIVIRDSKRLHKFSNGHCSCGDFSNLL
ncbi:PREDICTED: pentatricopeptide repeat-containing protein At3g24000, mitochondrial-like [Nelumbo nucifera]|uniref:Pentatricopeptide repeat-containing protein At3g24000, mitochondrial-like n=1 Tax=Nelumbo nucifera TaxID=4432 RepID=A0A1U7ZAC0_NELNU|nr:PREDICTED: pentatricopeptide repeat-containing protein At3g24000, mitochondrial-like [Nelumbo nucifera]